MLDFDPLIRRSLPNGRTDIIKAMGNTKWGKLEVDAPPARR